MARSPGVPAPHRRAAVAMAVVAFLAAVLAGCAPAAPDRDSGATRLTAVVTVHAGEAAVVADGHSAPAGGARLEAGDSVTASGADALIELAWSDGAVTRLGPGTEFTIDQPAGARDERGSQTGGVTWHRPAERDGAPYGVRIDGAVVTERGPFFAVDCRNGQCRVVSPIAHAADAGTITTFRWGDGMTTVGTQRGATWSELFADPWAKRNADLDAAAGFAPVTEAFAAQPERAALSGTYDVTAVGTTLECTGGGCAGYRLTPPGAVRTFAFVFGTDCTRGMPCVPQVTTEFSDLNSGERLTRTLDLRFADATYAWGFSDRIPLCVWTNADRTTEPTGSGENALSWTARPTAAAIVDGAFVVTSLTGTSLAGTTIVERTDTSRYPGCDYWEVAWSATGAVEMTRRVG